MIDYEVLLTDKAKLDLRGIFEYIAFELLSPDTAAGQLDRLEDSIISLAHFPERNRLYEREPWKSRKLRVMVVDNYLVLYIVNKDLRTVNVIRVMYAGRNVDKHLNENQNIQ